MTHRYWIRNSASPQAWLKSADLVTRDASGALWVHPGNGSTTGDPWPTSVAAGTGWQYADLQLD